MKAPKNCLDKPKNIAPWLTFGLKQNWQMLVFYAILLFLVCIMVTVSGIADAVTNLEEGWGVYVNGTGMTINRDKTYYCDELFRVLGAAFAVVSCFLGVFAGMGAGGYVNSRRAVHCYHSLPLTREALYLQNSAVHGLYYLASSLFTLLICTVAILTRLSLSTAGLVAGLWLMLCGIASFLVVFGLFQLAGSLTGTAIFRFCMAGIIAFLPIVLYLLLYFGVNLGMNKLNADNYFYNISLIRFLCPAVNIVFSIQEGGGLDGIDWGGRVLSLFNLLLTAAVYYGAGLACHRKRPSERSENALVWKKLGVVVKYPVVFVCATYGGLLFREIFGTGTTWMVFGGIIGLVLSFFLMNVLLERNTKSMFRGLKGLGVTALCAVVFYALFPFDILGLNYFMYEPDAVGYILLEYNGTDIKITDPAQLETVTNAIRNQIEREKAQKQGTSGDTLSYDDTMRPADNGTVPTYYINSQLVHGQSQKAAETMLDRYFMDRYVADFGDNPKQYYWTGAIDKLKGDVEEPVRENTTATLSRDVVTTAAKAYPDYGYGGDLPPGSDRLDFSVYPKFGLPVHRYIRIPALSADQVVYEIAKENEWAEEKYTFLTTKPVEEIYSVTLDILGDNFMLYMAPAKDVSPEDPQYQALQGEILGAVQELVTSAAEVPTETTIRLGTLWLRGAYNTEEESYGYAYPLYAGMTDFWENWSTFTANLPTYMEEAEGIIDFGGGSLEDYAEKLSYTRYQLYDDPAAVTDWLAETTIAHAWVIQAETGESLYVPADRYGELLDGCRLEYYDNDYGVRDSEYMVAIVRYTNEAIRKGTSVDNPSEADTVCYQTWFREGAVPAFVGEMWG